MHLLKIKIREIWKLSLPITISFVAIGLMGIVDTIVVGRYNTNQLAYMGIANSVFVILFTIPIALLQGVMIKSSQKFGARKFASCGKIYNEGKRYLVWLAVIFTSIGLCGEHILRLMGQNEQMSVEGGRLLQVLSLSIPFILMAVNANFFLQSIKRPHISMYSAVIANVINIILNPVLVFGWLGMPEMGAMGAVVVSVVIRVFMAAFSLVYIYNMKKTPKLNKRFGLDRSYPTWWYDSTTTRKIGIGAAVTTVSVNGSFSMASMFAGWMGEDIMATFVIITTAMSILFMMFFSVTQATSMVVANAYGRKNLEEIVASFRAGFVILFGAMAIFLTLFGLFPQCIFGVFSDDPNVIGIAVSLIALVIYDVVVDTLPLNVVGSLNGCGDVKVPTTNQVISYLVVRLLGCYVLAIGFEMGIKGLIIGLSFGGLASFSLNYLRYRYLVGKKLKFA